MKETSSIIVEQSPLVFISHDTHDEELAHAFSVLLNGLSAGRIKCFWSSDKRGGNGIDYGDEWYRTLIDNLKRATDVVCLLTKRSLNRPWILYEAGVAAGMLHKPVLGLALGIPKQEVCIGPFAQFQNCGDNENELTKLVFQLLERIPDASPSNDAIQIQVRAFNEKIKEIHRKMPINVSECKALVLAAGKSGRWQASIRDSGINEYYSNLYWQNVNKNLIVQDLPVLDSPPTDPGLHKSCACLDTIPIIHYAFLSYLHCGIKDLLAVVSSESHAQEQILRYIKLWNTRNHMRIDHELVTGESETAYSAFVGLKNFSNVEGDIIVSYSDIVWENRLLKSLLNQQGDVVILVDTSWRKNYPSRRIWHDELYAELVFGRDGHIDKIGEIVNRFENIPEWTSNIKRVDGFESLLQQNCIGEIIGLFKFSTKGRKAFCETYANILDSENKCITVAEWNLPTIGIGTTIKPNSNRIPIKKALLGCFLEYLARQNESIDVRIVEVQGGWVEVDHWGDLCIATDRLKYNHPNQLNLSLVTPNGI